MTREPAMHSAERRPDRPSSAAEDVPELTGVLERITYHSADTGYTVARLAVEGANDLVTVVGNFTNPVAGECVTCRGHWVFHREFGRQFNVERYETTRPVSAFAIQRYLGSGLIPGIGPVMAERLVKQFGLETLDVIDQRPRKLLEVEGIGAKRVASIKKAWGDQREIRRLMLFLQEHGVAPTYAAKIFKAYGDDAVAVVQDNPYRLARDIWGIGFRTADRIAQQIGIPLESERRLEAGVLYVLTQATDFGHLYLPERKLLEETAEALQAGAEKLPEILQRMIAAETVIAGAADEGAPGPPEDRQIFLPPFYYTEVGLAAQIARRIMPLAGPPASRPKITAWLAEQERRLTITLSDEQKEAVARALLNRLLILTGRPGTGKTTVTNLIARAFDAQGKRLLLVSPTGRAAKRLSEVTRRYAQTIHRALKFSPKNRAFEFNENNPLPCDALIADEVSMLDAVLAHNLLKAIPQEAQIVLVGDSDQLPSVGPGNVLGDLLASGMVPSIRLTQVFRQAKASLIITNAHRIVQGEFPVLIAPTPEERRRNNCLWMEADDPADGADKVVRLVSRSLATLGFGPDDIQVLAPMHKGAIGVAALNERLQDALNPADGSRPELVRGSRRFRLGDRVLQLKNNYEKRVFNGDIGVVTAIRPADQALDARFGDETVTYDFADYDELQLAYAMSVHKAQGSEYPAVVLVMHSCHYMLLQRNLFYTGLTRARRLCVIVGNKQAVGRAVSNDKTARRFTTLARRLAQQDQGPQWSALPGH